VHRRTLDRLATVVPAVMITAVAAALFSQTRHFDLLGFDAYPIIASSRVRSFADLIGNFSEPLMDGRHPGRFHRPLLNLSFALDHAVWGLNPFGYQLTSALILAACAAALWWLARRLLGPEARIGATVTLAVFLLSVIQFEVLPAPARRPEFLCCAFMALALALQLAPGELARARPRPWPALATLLAVASKETGYVLPVLLALAVALYLEHEPWRERLRRTARALVPHLAVVALMLAIRTAVLSGLGGHPTTSPDDIAGQAPATLRAILDGLLWPQPAMRRPVTGRWLPVVVALVLAALPFWGALRVSAPAGPSRPARAGVVALAWSASLALACLAAGINQQWYLLLPLAGWALLAGSGFEQLLTLAARDARPVRVAAGATLVLVVVLLAWQSSYSPLFREYTEWARATAHARSFLGDARARIDGAADGTVVHAAPLPTWVRPRRDRPSIHGAAILQDYSVQAWADLSLPGRTVRVRSGPPVDGPAPGEVLLLITRKRQVY
jgi:hypothetical protein